MNDRQRFGADRVHDLPPHCCPTQFFRDGVESFSECCVGALLGACRKCGQVVWVNSECPAPPEPEWTAKQWHDNWDQHGHGPRRTA